MDEYRVPISLLQDTTRRSTFRAVIHGRISMQTINNKTGRLSTGKRSKLILPFGPFGNSACHSLRYQFYISIAFRLPFTYRKRFLSSRETCANQNRNKNCALCIYALPGYSIQYDKCSVVAFL